MTWPIPDDRTVIVKMSQKTGQPALHFDRDCMQLKKVDDDRIKRVERGERPYSKPCSRCLGKLDCSGYEPTHTLLEEASADDLGLGSPSSDSEGSA